MTSSACGSLPLGPVKLTKVVSVPSGVIVNTVPFAKLPPPEVVP